MADELALEPEQAYSNAAVRRYFWEPIGKKYPEIVNTTPGLIYHYTDLAAFNEITKNHTIWASEARCLNDSSEIHYGGHLFRNYVENRGYRALGANSKIKEVLDYFYWFQDSDVSFRTTGRLVVPYMELRVPDHEGRLQPLPIRRVVIGPGSDQRVLTTAIKQMLDARGYGDVEVTASFTPVRIGV